MDDIEVVPTISRLDEVKLQARVLVPVLRDCVSSWGRRAPMH